MFQRGIHAVRQVARRVNQRPIQIKDKQLQPLNRHSIQNAQHRIKCTVPPVNASYRLSAMKLSCLAIFLCAVGLCAQPAPAAKDPLRALAFLQGTWEAKAHGDTGAQGNADYTFALELRGNVLARHGAYSSCKGPADFDCGHNDLLYVYADGPAQSLKAIYFDNEGHVIHYDVSTPDSTTAVFLSDSSSPGPRFRLTYSLKGGIMSGKFQMLAPGQTEWRSYLEWSGSKK